MVEFFQELDGREFGIDICSLEPKGATGEALAGRGCRVWGLGRRGGLDWRLLRSLARVVKASDPRIIHVHGITPLLYALPIALSRRATSLVFTCHFSRLPRGRVQRLATALFLRRAQAVVAVSQAALEVLVRGYHLPRRSVQLIHNGVDADRFTPNSSPDRTPPTVGFCGVFRPEKELPTLLEALALVRRCGVRPRLILVGDGPVRARCVQVADELGLSDSVEFIGAQADVKPWLERMDVFALPSSAEAMPVALLEAMAMGRAVVATRVGGIPEIVDHENNGLLVQGGDVQDLAHAILRLSRDRGLRIRLGEEARRTVAERFALTKMMAGYAALYRRVSGRVG